MLCHSGQRREQKTLCLCEICNSEQPSAITDRGLVISRSATRVCSNKCTATGTVRFGTKRHSTCSAQAKCYKTAKLPDMPVRIVTGDAELAKKRSLVRTQHRPLLELVQESAFYGRQREPEYAFGLSCSGRTATRTRSGSRHGSQACSQRVEGGILRDLQTRAKASGLLSASARSTRLWFRTSANRAIRVTLIGSRRM